MPNGVERLTQMSIPGDGYDYAPVPGLTELREAVANYYNTRFRQGCLRSTQAWPFVRAGVGLGEPIGLGNVHLGHFLPDYTAYEELLTA